MTASFCCGFECGAGHWNYSGTASISTTVFRSGLRSLRVNPTTGVGGARSVHGGSNQTAANGVGVIRCSVRFDTLPSASTILIDSVFTNSCGLWFEQSDSKLYARANGVNGATGYAVTTGVQYLVNMRLTEDGSAINVTVDVTIDGTALASPAAGSNGGASSSWQLGVINTATADVYFDDVLTSNTSGDYPLGDGYILSYIPNADGSHNIAGANDFERTLTGTDITNATTDAYTLVDERPLPTTEVDFINGVAPPNSTDYVEVAYEDSVEAAAPRSVEAIVVHHDAGGPGTNNWTWTLRDSGGGTSGDVHNGTTNVGANLTMKRAHFTTIPGGGAWTLTAFNALRSRFLVTDASPDVYIDAGMLEAEYAPVNIGGEHPITEWPMRRRLMVLAH